MSRDPGSVAADPSLDHMFLCLNRCTYVFYGIVFAGVRYIFFQHFLQARQYEVAVASAKVFYKKMDSNLNCYVEAVGRTEADSESVRLTTLIGEDDEPLETAIEDGKK